MSPMPADDADEMPPLTADLGTGRRGVERQRSAVPVERVARVTMTGFPLVGSLSPTREPDPVDGPHVRVTPPSRPANAIAWVTRSAA
jgi:hypothetical protein